MTEIDRLFDLLTAVYDAPLKPAGWSRLAAQSAALFEADGCRIQGCDLAKNSVRTIGEIPGTSPYPSTDLARLFRDHEMKYSKLPNAPSERIVSIEIVHEPSDSMGKARLSNRFVNSCFVADISEFSSGEFAVIALHRNRSSFTPEEKRWMEILVAHLQRALKIQSRLSSAEAAGRIELDILQAVKTPVLLVDEQARIVFSNEMAESLLAKAAGIRNVSGIVQATERGAAARLIALIGSATSSGHGNARNSVLAVPRDGGRPLSLIVAPLPRPVQSAGSEPALALIMIGDPDQRARPALAALVDLYGLTRAEAKLLDCLLAGERLQEYAEHAGLSINTAKSQLAQLFQKTGHSRQSDLLREIGADPIWTLM